jgi:hypothetical protein
LPFGLAILSCKYLCESESFNSRLLLDTSWKCIWADTQIQIENVKIKISMSTQLHEILYTNSQNMLVQSYSIASCYHHRCCCFCLCFTDSSTNPGNCG